MDIVFETAVKYNDIFMAGAKITIIISFLSCFFGLFLGVILAFMKISGVKILQAVAAVYVEVIRGTPVLVQISLVFFGLPFLGIQFPNFEIWGVDFERLSAGVLAHTSVKLSVPVSSQFIKGSLKQPCLSDFRNGNLWCGLLFPRQSEISCR